MDVLDQGEKGGELLNFRVPNVSKNKKMEIQFEDGERYCWRYHEIRRRDYKVGGKKWKGVRNQPKDRARTEFCYPNLMTS